MSKSKGLKNRILSLGLAVCVFAGALADCQAVFASSISEVQNQIKSDQKNLDDTNQTISNLSDEQDLLEEEIADLESEVVNFMTSIGLKEDEIAAKENEIAQKQVEIGQAQKDYEAAKAREEQQYEDMKQNIRFMYESGDTSFLSLLFDGDGLGDLLNRAEYVEMIYQYDQKLLNQYEESKNQVQALWDQLEADKVQLEADKEQLVADKAELQVLKAGLDEQLQQLRKKSADYDAKIKQFQQQAASYKKKIQKEEQDLKRLQEEERKRAEAAKNSGATNSAVNAAYKDTSYTSVIDGAQGSDLGKKIAKYAVQFIGNPYVLGGTSLTNGADCSGFIYRIYKDFGYNLPRTSTQQRGAGKEVSYANAQPGDIICYSGHVAMYIGGGLIVHASTAKTGIKVSNANYRSMITVRRII